MTKLSVRNPVTQGVVAILALVLGFGLWATLTQLSGAIVAQGQIEVERDRQVVQHPDGGVVAEILVTEGARVKAGQPLLRLDGAALYHDRAAPALGEGRDRIIREFGLGAGSRGEDALPSPAM